MYVSHTTHILTESFLLLIVYAYGTCGNVTLHNIHHVYALFTRILKLLRKVSLKKKSEY
jgi:hypothetical protein